MKRRAFLGTTGGFLLSLPFIRPGETRAVGRIEEIPMGESPGSSHIDLGPVYLRYQRTTIKADNVGMKITEEATDVMGKKVLIGQGITVVAQISDDERGSIKKVLKYFQPGKQPRLTIYSKFMAEEIVFYRARITEMNRVLGYLMLTFSVYPKESGRNTGIIWRMGPKGKTR